MRSRLEQTLDCKSQEALLTAWQCKFSCFSLAAYHQPTLGYMQALEGLAFHDSDPSARRAASWALASACQAARQARHGAGRRSQPSAGAAGAGRQQVSLQQAAVGLPEDSAMRCLLDQVGQCELRCLDAGWLMYRKDAANLEACISASCRPEGKLGPASVQNKL